MTVQERWVELADIKDELAARDWFPGTSGNLAIRVSDDPLTFLVTASGRDKRKRTNEDFVLVDATGQLIGEQSGKPSAETLLHVEIFNNTNATCSLHVHTVDNNVISELYAAQGHVTFTGQEIIKALGYWEETASVRIPIIENHADIPTLARAFAPHVTGDAGAVLIRNHGITVWGETPAAAKRYLEAYEFLFSYSLKLRALGVHS
ncbi:methylthioribulose-1-phosphate dehydratase [Exiguobacterium sp. AT1b]|jgi:methylthioribulose-1-phosphate dehydratase|uniref:Methylthioribulose-1-phosphate dehydratase n=1 Tax=Exiguobacterium sp. (strain ATCC BAA-1283 / AT1b) TaxID=360911 RepID=MTNB_EXISA|nr:methylthioribulose 1-phosphate dehydratase [Exiguobacterium sp. AT1b]C4KZ52.1 RecName: Full=Methylthioribulose-1-phosphate dehydratase; Short=MTRu-1-P dehydratase [Exiguobacterium sp. AT1b]ACQ70365.1 methylthioribulose-1-phosphate dehydratase [Exiguobacterium sp. AT1b]